MKKQPKSRRRLGTVALAVLVIAALVWGFWPRPVMVETVEARRAPLRVTVEEEGRTRARDRFVVSAPVAGFMRRIAWQAGDRIRSGDIVTHLEPQRSPALDPRTREQAEARVRTAEAAVRAAEERARIRQDEVRTAQVNAAHARKEAERAAPLLQSGDISREYYDKLAFEARRAGTALDTAEQAVAAARADVGTARAEVAAARAALAGAAAPTVAAPSSEIVAVRSPVGGRILRLIRESEGVVSPGEPLVEIADARALEVEVEVLSADAVRMGPATRVLFERWGGEQPLEGAVRTVEPRGFTKISALGVEEQRVLVIADITSPEAEWRRLGDGYRVEASFVLWEADQVLQVPAAALFRHGNDQAVFVVENGVARRRIVHVGRRTGLAAQILSGLKEGERVIVHPDDAVTDGKAVEVKQD